MFRNGCLLFAALLTALIVPGRAQEPAGIDFLQKAFERPPDDARIMMRWWWFGPAVTQPEIERELRVMKDGGIGGVEIQPVYPLALDDPGAGIKNLRFLSDEFIDAVRFASQKGRELGMRVDFTLGSGWPYGGPMIPVTQAAAKLRVDKVKLDGKTRRVFMPYLENGEKSIAVFLVGSGGTKEVTQIRDGAAWVPAGTDGELQFFSLSRTGQQVKRAAFGAEGFVLDHYDRAAVNTFLTKIADRSMEAFKSQPPYAIFCDSMEVYGSNWTGDFMEEFRKRRGYDLRPYLPMLATDLGGNTAEVRHDWGRTLTELYEERFMAPMQEWARKYGTKFRVQSYGTPPAALASYRLSDLPEGEGSNWKVLRPTRWASSASHLLGKPVTSSETWTWLHSPAFRATPLDMKAEADRHFLQGVNQIIGHGWPYTPPTVAYPGWRLYAAAVFDDKNPWYIVMPDLALYLQRMSYLLRQGEPANDVALYLPTDDAWSAFHGENTNLLQVITQRMGPNVLPRILEAGFNLDCIDDGMLERFIKVERGALVAGGHRYRVVVLPNVERIPVATLRKLAEFVQGGGTLVATVRLPDRAPGLQAPEAETREIRETVAKLFSGNHAPARLVKDENSELAAALSAHLKPDVTLSAAAPAIGFVHRSTGTAEVYFIANTANTPQSLQATFRVEGLQPEWWDAFSGRVTPAGSGATVALDLPPYGSRVLVFSKRSLAAKPVRPASFSPIDLGSGWTVSFGEGIKPVHLDALRSWSEDEQTRYYSGVATYEREFTVPQDVAGQPLVLDFGEGKPVPDDGTERSGSGMLTFFDPPVREAAVVYVNGQRAGAIFTPPYSVEVTGLIKPGANHLRIQVANTALNYMAGRRLPDYRLLTLEFGERFQAQDMDKVRVLPSGLLGPVRLVGKP